MKPKKIPMRMCLGCGEMRSKKELIRVVKSPEGEISLDFTGKKSGRGAYICRSGACLRASIRNHGLERSLRTSIPEEISRQLEEEMSRLE